MTKANRGLSRLVIAKAHFSNNVRVEFIHGYHQMVNTKNRLIILFVVKNGEILYSQLKQDLELTVAQIMSSLLQNLGLKKGKLLDHSGMT